MAKSETDILTGISAAQRLARPFPQVTVVEPGRGIEPRTYSLRVNRSQKRLMRVNAGGLAETSL